MEGLEEILLDHNQIANGLVHCSLGVFKVSPDHKLLAYALDTKGSEQYTINIKDLETGKLLTDVIEDVTDSFEWMNDSKSFVYTRFDNSMRPDSVFIHRLGDDTKTDKMLYREDDKRFMVDINKSKSNKYIFVHSHSKMTNETHYFDADLNDITLTVIESRRNGHEYVVEHHGSEFYILTNKNGTKDVKNFRLVCAPITSPNESNWIEILAENKDISLVGIEVFKNYICIFELKQGITRIRIHKIETREEYHIEFNEEAYSIIGGENPNFDSDVVRLQYSSLITPPMVIDYNMDDKTKEIVKQKEILGGYNQENYVVERLYVEASDGTNIPITLARKKNVPRDGTAPCWLSGYGSYGIMQTPYFSPYRLSLLDRGFVYAIAHIRGGGENGKSWYEAGKFLKKKNTFTDYIAVAEKLIEEKYTSKDKLVACGRSAGGLLIGAVVNMRPDLFKVAIAGVPFVDVINTMMDPTIPLTVMEYEEWGDPNEKNFFDYILSYSPYDNIKAQNYPHMLVNAGLNDPRVQYWEAAKWVAKLRTIKTDNNLLLLKTEMTHGHMGASGRYQFIKEIAFEYAFVFKALSG